MSQIATFLNLSSKTEKIKFLKGLRNPSDELQVLLLSADFLTNDDSYFECLRSISQKTLEWTRDWWPCIDLNQLDADAICYFLKYDGEFDDSLDERLNALSDADKFKILDYYTAQRDGNTHWVKKQSDEFQIKYINRYADIIHSLVNGEDFDVNDFSNKAYQHLMRRAPANAKIQILYDKNNKREASKANAENIILDWLKTNPKFSIVISGKTAVGNNKDFHKNPSLGLINAALTKILSGKELNAFLETKPNLSNSNKIKTAASVNITLITPDHLEILLFSKKLIDAVRMIKTLEM